jgi:two-component system nitrate/nitrite response regulator NarL
VQLVRPDRERLRIIVAHRHELVAEALGQLLESLGLLVLGAACDLEALLERLPESPAEVLLLDAGFDATAGPIVALQRIRDVAPEARVVVLAESLDGTLGVLLREGDLDGVVLASVSGTELVAAVAQVVAGHSVFPAGWMRNARRVAAGSPLSQLSPRQREVLALLALGMDNDQIATRLYISRNTVKFHVRTIYERLGVHNRVAAARVLAGADIVSAA